MGFGSAYYFMPSKIVEKTKIVTETKTKNNVVTVVTEKPDGSKTTVITDKTTVDTDSKIDHTKITESNKPNWALSASYLSKLNGERMIVGSLSRRLIGNIYVGVTATSTGSAGVGVTLVF